MTAHTQAVSRIARIASAFVMSSLVAVGCGSAASSSAPAHVGHSGGVAQSNGDGHGLKLGHKVGFRGLPDSPAKARQRGETEATGGISSDRFHGPHSTPNQPAPTAAKSSVASGNWSGIVGRGATHTFQGVAGDWHVPQVYVSPQSRYGCTWVGVDGSGTSSLIQAGAEEDYVNGHARYYAWWEILPAAQTLITYSNGALVPVKPGDYMYSYIYQSSPGVYRIFLDDVTQNWYFDQYKYYSGPGVSVDWVQEATQVGGKIQQPTNFGTVGFGYMYVMENGTWYYTALGAANEWNIVQNGVQYTSTSAPTATQPQTFRVKYIGP
jgi:hypothetical protein